METPREAKSNLSKHLLQMKFMQRSALRVQKEDYDSEQQKYVDDEHWKLDIPDLIQKESKYITETSYVFCEDLRFGRISYKGFNPEIEKLMKSQDQEQELELAGEREKEISVGDTEMANRYTTLVGTIAKKFSKKRHKEEDKDSDDDEEEISAKKPRDNQIPESSQPSNSQGSRKSRRFQYTSKDKKTKSKSPQSRYF